jgi:hypothetical protein
MFKTNKISLAVKLATAATLGALTISANAFAQQSSDEEEIEKISVTGSRIKSAELTSASPLQILDAADIDASGIANIQELLLDNPTFGTPAISRTNSNFSTWGCTHPCIGEWTSLSVGCAKFKCSRFKYHTCTIY